MENYDFSGWATRANLRCSDGRTIMKDAFKHCDGSEVPLVWNHQHNDPDNILGKALLHNMDEGVYAYCTFNDSESGKTAKLLVQHGDVKALSIYANQLKEHMSHVSHGTIREVSLVLAGANPGAYIESVIKHGEESDEEAIIYTGEDIEICHADEAKIEDILEHADDKKETDKEETIGDVFNTFTEKQKNVVYALIGQLLEESEEDNSDDNEKDDIKHSDTKKEDFTMAEETKKTTENEETIADVFNTLSEKQKTVVYALIGQALEDAGATEDDEDDEDDEVKHSDYEEGDGYSMKHNIFDNDDAVQTGVLSHADQQEIINLAKSPSVGSLKAAMQIYGENHADTLAHGIDNVSVLFPDYKDVYPGAPELLERDHNWVAQIMMKAHKSPVSRIRTRHADARAAEIRAKGYTNRESQKAISGNVSAVMRTTDPQTVYYRDNLHRDDVVDITDFDVIAYQKNILQNGLEEEVARAALIGDGRAEDHADKISPEKIRPIWTDSDVYTIKATVDVDAMATTLQGTNTNANFGEEYIFAEAVVASALYSREQYKGQGTPDFYCAPHTLNMMLLARDLNGRRIYDSKADLAKVLNVGDIFTVEQMTGLTRTDDEGNELKLLGIFVNMANYTFGCAKGGEITNFEDFDIDFNQYKYLIETRLSGALTHPLSAIALEQPVSPASAG